MDFQLNLALAMQAAKNTDNCLAPYLTAEATNALLSFYLGQFQAEMQNRVIALACEVMEVPVPERNSDAPMKDENGNLPKPGRLADASYYKLAKIRKDVANIHQPFYRPLLDSQLAYQLKVQGLASKHKGTTRTVHSIIKEAGDFLSQPNGFWHTAEPAPIPAPVTAGFDL
jgi:hypothetical protein